MIIIFYKKIILIYNFLNFLRVLINVLLVVQRCARTPSISYIGQRLLKKENFSRNLLNVAFLISKFLNFDQK